MSNVRNAKKTDAVCPYLFFLFICNTKLLKQWVVMIKRINRIASSIVKVITKPLLTMALLRFMFSLPLNMLA